MSSKVTQEGPAAGEPLELDLARLFGELIDHRLFIAIITALCLICATGYALLTTPVYMADAMVQVEQKQGNSLLSNLNSLTAGYSPESAPEIQLLKSRMVLGKTVKDLNLRYSVKQRYFPFFGKGWARLTGQKPAELTLVWLDIAHREEGYPPLTLIAEKDGHYRLEGEGIALRGRVGTMLNSDAVNILVSEMVAQPGTRFTVTLLPELKTINDLNLRFSVTERAKDSGILYLTLIGSDPERIARTLNSIADNYLQQNIDRQAAQDSKSLAFLQRKLPEVRADLDRAEERLNAYRKNQESVDLNLEAKSVLEQIVNVDNQLNELTFREAEISQLYKKDHPTYRALLEKHRTLEQEKDRLNKRVGAMPSTQQEIIRLSRDVDSGRAVYQQLLTRQQELNVSKSSAIGNVRIIDAAKTQPDPIKPKKPLIVALGFLMGLMLSSGFVIVRAAVRKGIESPEQLEACRITVYATLPRSEWLARKMRWHKVPFLAARLRKKSPITPFLPAERPMDNFVEAIRGLRTNLHFTMMDAENNLLMITGPSQNCGKTMISTSLAAILAHGGQRVLFIDSDMRRGYVHHLFRLQNEVGLSSVLAGQTASAEAIQHYATGGFDVMTCGPTPPNPSELLMHERFGQLMKWASKNYEMVIIDTPPVLAVTDASLIGRFCASTLLIARFGVTSVKEVQVCVRRLKQAGIVVKGAILNDVVKRAAGVFSAGYDYYEHSYSDEDAAAAKRNHTPRRPT